MTRIITYDLRQGALDSDEYYRTIASFADTWLDRTIREAGDILTSFRQYRQSRGKVDRSDGEYALELLALGVLLREHGNEAINLPNWSIYILKRLLDAQSRWPRQENRIKRLRGWVGWLASHTKAAHPDRDAVGRLVVWLSANGEDGRAKRLTEWHDYFETSGSYPEQDLILISLALADDFANASLATIGKYTIGVEQFLIETAPRYRLRYDAGLISRTRLEYHLGMLGTEILNRAYRQRFLSTPRKVVILPPCMRAQPDTICKALATPFGARCQYCTPTCRVHQITRLGEKRGFDVFMIPEELRVFGTGEGKSGFGVVGVSCALTNWGGGWDTNTIGIPAQGILLDYVGCKYHWDEQGIPTDTNLGKLQEVLGLEIKDQ
jgi:hypothetical protein